MSDAKEDKSAVLRLLGSQIIESGSRDYLIVTSSEDGSYNLDSSNRTWAMGAAKRVQVMFEEIERLETQDDYKAEDA